MELLQNYESSEDEEVQVVEQIQTRSQRILHK